jgi:hypothetical protein
VALVVLAITIAACGDGSANATPVAPANVPPAGAVWFGTSFDTQTLAISGRLVSVTANQGFSFVAHLPRVMDASALLIRTSLDGDLVATVPVSATGSSDLWGFSPGPLFAVGAWRYDMTDIGGNVLATGTITATN